MERSSPLPIDYRAFVESTPLVPWELDGATGRVTYVGPQARDFLGYPLDVWLDASFWRDHVLPDDQARVAESRDTLLRDGGAHTIEYRMEHADGRLVWVAETATRACDSDGGSCLRGLLGDITERKRVEDTLTQTALRLRALIQSAPDALVFTDADGNIANMNDQAGYLLGYELAEIRGSSIDLLVPDGLRPRMAECRAALNRDQLRRSLVDGQALHVQRSDGQLVPVEISVSVVPLHGARQLLYAVRDLTARHRIEQRLRQSEARLRGMADALPDLVSFVDREQRYRFVNEAYAKWVGWDPRAMEGRTVEEVLGPALYEQVRPSIETALSGVAVRLQGTADIAGAIHAGGSADVTYLPQREGEEVTGYFVIVRSSPVGRSGSSPGGAARRA